MLTFKEISTSEAAAREAAELIQDYSWGRDYPVHAWSELQHAQLIVGCFDGERLVGTGSITPAASPDGVDNNLPWLATAVVLPEYRGRGIYTELYEQRMKYLRKTGERLVLSCTDNPLIERFLTSNGWVLRRVTKDEAHGACTVFERDPRI